MVYSNNKPNPAQVLYLGKYKRYDFFILNLGTHPTAYVRIPRTHPFFGKDYDYCSPPHGFEGGPFTFSNSSANFANFLDTPIPGGWYLGWDYAHINDWLGYLSDEQNIQMGNHKHTTEEMILDCKNVIEYLLEVKNEPRK